MTFYAYNLRIRSFSDGNTTFMAEGDVNTKRTSADGPRVISHMTENEAGAIIDLDGTGPATLVPPLVTADFIFVGANPAAHTQYANLVALTGLHGTLTGILPGISANQLVTAPARLIEVKAVADGAQRIGTTSWLPVTATWQLKGFWS